MEKEMRENIAGVTALIGMLVMVSSMAVLFFSTVFMFGHSFTKEMLFGAFVWSGLALFVSMVMLGVALFFLEERK
jgi:uncharacterized membrane protein